MENELINEVENVFLCFIKLIGKESDGYYRYEFIFTDNVDEVWGNDFNVKPACLVNGLMVEDEYIYEVHTVKTKIKLDLAQDNCCFSMSDILDGICALGWENVDEYDEYPEDRGRLFFKFGETLETVEEKLAKCNILMGM